MLMAQDGVSPEHVIGTCESARGRLGGCFVFHPEKTIASFLSHDGRLSLSDNVNEPHHDVPGRVR
jgi:hypothetical protein